ncbi:flagellar filament capping protein FliD [Alkalimonas amylolytica]|uniref:Flagellar hook-associated protein 2 n=1 Tax=Alkalimonas amylolytica TaxID=152573 RepID=A0A1H4B904_ALKAM|nr:flagellar filament capping protein FliD [Alkalimonas amylolytica]SEA44619.1 flagellar hook-associated protein 2 [Alkalimonas amylolytica]
MSGVNFLGSASGLPLNDLVMSFVNVERQTKMGRIEDTRKQLDASLSGFGRLKSALSGLRQASRDIGGTKLNQRQALINQPEDKTYFRAETNFSAAPGRFEVNVNQLAGGSRLESADGDFTSANDVVSTTAGQLTFSADGKNFTINVTAGMTLDQLRLRINQNKNNFGVDVNLINAGDGLGTKMVFTSKVTGDGNDLVISNNNAELDKLSTVATGPDPAGLEYSRNARNAIIEVDGITATSKTNTFKNVIQDTTIFAEELTEPGNPIRLEIATDKEAAEEKINTFIERYNAVVTLVADLTKGRKLSSDGKTVEAEGGSLSGDPLPRSLMSQLRNLVSLKLDVADSNVSTLFQMGIGFTNDGKLSISSNREFGGESGRQRFERTLDQNYDDMARFFGADDGLVDKLDKYITEFSQAGGIIATKESVLRDQLSQNTKASEAAERYLASFEDTLRKRYGALDSLLGSMQNTANFVTAQLANLPGFGVNKSK